MSELLLIFMVVLLVFGAKRIPEIARGLGKGIREFKDATNDIKRELTVDESKNTYQRIPAPSYSESIPRTEPYPQPAATQAPAQAAQATPPAAPPAEQAPN